jgi:hypothetical protein
LCRGIRFDQRRSQRDRGDQTDDTYPGQETHDG